jgi:hypothetical protein
MRAKLHLPAGPLRRFRLPPSAARSVHSKQGLRKRTWALLPFSLFALLTYWLSAGRPLPDVRHWLDGPPRADRSGTVVASGAAPLLEAPTAQPIPPPLEEPVAGAPAAPTLSESEARLAKPQKRKPPLALGRHRLRPVLGWEEPSHGESSSVDSKRDRLRR